MKRIWLFLVFALASCAPAVTPVAAETPPLPTSTPPATLAFPSVTPPPVTPTTLPPSPTATLIQCNPLVAEFCVTEGHFLFQNPILPPGNPFVEAAYRYGSTQNGLREPHHGVEFVNATGTPVHAAADGWVVFAGPDEEAVYSPWKNFYGNIVVIRHSGGFFTLYAHLSVVNVQAGRQVAAGEKIGEVGLTGSADGSHLHFEVRRGSVEDYFSTLNPELWLMPPAGEGALAISVVDESGKPRRAEITIRSDDEAYFIKTYEEKFSTMEENAGLALRANRYRIAFVYGGKIYERWAEVQSGKLTQVVIIVK